VGLRLQFFRAPDCVQFFPRKIPEKQDAVEVKMKDLKAIFFCEGLRRNREYQDDVLPELLSAPQDRSAFSDEKRLSERRKRITAEIRFFHVSRRP